MIRAKVRWSEGVPESDPELWAHDGLLAHPKPAMANIASCDSTSCAGSGSVRKAIKFGIPTWEVWCPDCGCALFWERVRIKA